MKNTLYLSIFGLNLTLINELKKSISNILENDYHLAWTNIADPNLNILFIHENFIELDNIQKIIQNKKILHLKLTRQSTSDFSIKDNTLTLPLKSEQDLSQWLTLHLNTMEENQNQVSEITHYIKKLTYKDVQPFLAELNTQQHQGKYSIQIDGETVAVLDFDHYKFYGNSKFNLFESSVLEIHRASLNCITRFKRLAAQDLKQGLWQMYWHNLKFDAPIYNGYYHTSFWPRITDQDEQNILFKLAAHFSQGACPLDVQHATKISPQYIHQYLLCCQLTQCCHEISASSAKFHFNDGIQKSEKPALSFFQKLRRKLGL